MNSGHGAAAGVVHAFECSVPFQGDRGAAGNAGLARNGACSALAGEKLRKDGPVVLLLLALLRMYVETLRGVLHLAVRNRLGRNLLERVYP